MDDETTQPGTEGAFGVHPIIFRALVAALVVGNLVIVWDLLRDTAEGRRLAAWMRSRTARVRDCEGCARRRAALHEVFERRFRGAAESVQLEAEAIVGAEGQPS